MPLESTREQREAQGIYQAERVLLGLCPECQAPIVILNNREVWPLAMCACGWADGTEAIAHRVRYERGRPGSTSPAAIELLRIAVAELWGALGGEDPDGVISPLVRVLAEDLASQQASGG